MIRLRKHEKKEVEVYNEEWNEMDIEIEWIWCKESRKISSVICRIINKKKKGM